MTDEPSEWYWRVIVEIPDRGELILGEYASNRAAAKRKVRDRLDVPVLEWRRCYIPRPSWDCPVCGTHEAATKAPNLRGDYDWECNVCGSKLWGEPLEWDKIREGHRVPNHRRDTTTQAKLGGDDV